MENPAMEMRCPHCREVLALPTPDKSERSWLPWVAVLGFVLLLIVGLIGFATLAGLSYFTMARSQAQAQAVRAVAEAERAAALEQRALAEARRGDEKERKHADHQEAMRGLLSDALQLCDELVGREPAAMPPPITPEMRDRLSSLRKRLAELKETQDS